MRKRKIWMGTALLALGTFCPVSRGRTWTVGATNTPCPNPDYTTITAAVNAASPGDVIQICPAVYPEQLTITIPLTLMGISELGVGGALIQPAQLQTVEALSSAAVITVVNTSNVTIQNVGIDAGNNNISGCGVALAGIYFHDASGTVDSVSISGTRLSDPTSCSKLFPGNGFGIEADEDANSAAPYSIAVWNSSIHDFSRNGILVMGLGETVDIENNTITGVGPSTGVNQFGIFLANGTVGKVVGNSISQGNCGAVDIPDCYNLRSEGVVLRAVGDGVLVDSNMISNVQAGVFVNGATHPHVTNNTVNNVDALSGIHLQGSVSGLYQGNRVFHVGPLTTDTSSDEEGCGVNDVSGTNSLANTIQGNLVNDAYCGVAYVSGDLPQGNIFRNTLYETLDSDFYPEAFPSPVRPGQPSPSAANQGQVLRRLRRVVE